MFDVPTMVSIAIPCYLRHKVTRYNLRSPEIERKTKRRECEEERVMIKRVCGTKFGGEEKLIIVHI